ncbi:MAG TPA: hypothetical protein VKE50_02670, partial [Thermoanaerobaculia bacterium]|nr:hypothetical protein [Thermoanaerobaculia bacterium]
PATTSATVANPIAFYTVTPCRVVDTRDAPGPLGGPALAGGSVRTFTISGQCGIPSGTQAVSANVTAVQASAGGDFRLFPGGSPLPPTSTLNYHAGAARANNAIVSLGPSGDLSVRCDQPGGTAQFILDVNGYFQ